MITLHHLRVGRSVFTVWLLEELDIEYDLKIYLRDPKTNRSQADLKAVHPLGKSPLIEDGDIMLAESGAIATYLLEHHDPENRLSPSRSDNARWAEYQQWLHYSEGSAFLPLIMNMLLARETDPKPPVTSAFAAGETKLHLDYVRDFLADKTYLLGEDLQAPDIGMGFILTMASKVVGLQNYPTLEAYLGRLTQRPAFARAMERPGG